MVNNYPEYAAGVNYKKTDSNNVTHFYSAQVVADPSDDTIESKLIKDGVVISEGGGGGSSDFSTAEVTIQITSQQPNAQILIPTIISSSIEAIINTPYNTIEVSTPHTITVPLYKGSLIVDGDWPSGDVTVNVSGSVEVMETSFHIKGDCTITIS